MCYPHLHELIAFCRDHGLGSNVALSGWGIDETSLQKLIDCGVSNIYISLNGSTEEVNRQTRDGYNLAIHALELLKKKSFPNTRINWVMHTNNAADFPNVVKLAEDYGVKSLVVLVFKPNSDYELPSVPTYEQVYQLSRFIRAYRGPVEIVAESCFSQLRALLNQGFLGNLNRGIARGCGAGRDGISVSADGKLTPCRHLEIEEDYRDISTYWRESPTLKALRAMEDAPEDPCKGCQYMRFCLPCAAANYKQKGRIFMGCHCCPIHPMEQEEI
jgi:pyrroloquinoline quinone biosynthesis protein E